MTPIYLLPYSSLHENISLNVDITVARYIDIIPRIFDAEYKPYLMASIAFAGRIQFTTSLKEGT